jgi:hypothetical protein
MWLRIVVGLFVALAACITLVVTSGAVRWRSDTEQRRAALEAGRRTGPPTTYDSRELDGLPAPVGRYFRAALAEGQPIVSAIHVAYAGEFNLSETRAAWSPFTSTQLVIARRPGFDWDGRIRLAPGVDVFVHDSYVAGDGALRAALLGLVPVAAMGGTPEMAQGELMRFLAEAAWYPTALLPSQGVRWEAIDDTSARGTLTDGATSVSLVFRFDADGLIGAVSAAARHRGAVATPWEARFWGYATRDGMRIPLEGEVAWRPPGGPWPYWRGRITAITYEFAR